MPYFGVLIIYQGSYNGSKKYRGQDLNNYDIGPGVKTKKHNGGFTMRSMQQLLERRNVGFPFPLFPQLHSDNSTKESLGRHPSMALGSTQIPSDQSDKQFMKFSMNEIVQIYAGDEINPRNLPHVYNNSIISDSSIVSLVRN